MRDNVDRSRGSTRRIRIATAVALAASLATLALAIGAQAQQPPVGLGTAGSFAVLGGSAVTNTGPSVINGDLGVSPGTSVTGFPPGTVNGTIHAADAVAAQAQSDLTTAYNDAAGRTPAVDMPFGDMGGLIFTPGVYKRSSSLLLTGDVALDAQGDPDAVFVFQVGSTLTTASSSRVLLRNGAQACNVFWQIGSSATLGTNTSFKGNILALTSITMNSGATLIEGRALARNGAITLDDNRITRPRCTTPPPGTTPPPRRDSGARYHAIRRDRAPRHAAADVPGDRSGHLHHAAAGRRQDGAAVRHPPRGAPHVPSVRDRTQHQTSHVHARRAPGRDPQRQAAVRGAGPRSAPRDPRPEGARRLPRQCPACEPHHAVPVARRHQAGHPGPRLHRLSRATAGGAMAFKAGLGLAVLWALPCVPTATAAPASPPAEAAQELVAVLRPHAAFTRPSGDSRRLGLVAARRPITGERTVLPVIGRAVGADRRRWLRVRLPGRPNGLAGWIAQSRTAPVRTSWRLVVSLSTRRVTAFRYGRPVRSFRAIVGKPSTPTPRGRFFVEEPVRLRSLDAGAPFALATSARSEVLQEFAGGPGQIALHGVRNIGGRLGTAASHGCVRLSTRAITWLVNRIRAGTPLTIT